MPALTIERRALAAGVRTSITPPKPSLLVTVQNVANPQGDDLYVYDATNPDADHYVTIAPGWERPFEVGLRYAGTIPGSAQGFGGGGPSAGMAGFDPRERAFYLQIAHDATVVLLWG